VGKAGKSIFGIDGKGKDNQSIKLGIHSFFASLYPIKLYSMRVIRILSILIVIAIFNSGCLKDGYDSFSCTAKIPEVNVPAAEIAQVEAYLAANNITNAVKHPTGFYYIIEVEGTGNRPTICTNVAVTYKGQLTNGTVFDQTQTPLLFPLAQLITGWQLGLPLVKTGGKIRLFIPPTLGYGDRVLDDIPAKSVLIFDVTIIEA
jgi:FKBP-type peptidyl-prolyl cis-trans isomerase FkpA